MVKADEYVIEDVDGNGVVNSSDENELLALSYTYNSLTVKNIENNYTDYFPNALSPASADANCDGYIRISDYVSIYTYCLSGQCDRVGEMEFYEYFT